MISNYTVQEIEKKQVLVPIHPAKIVKIILDICEGWPKRIGNRLFVIENDRPRFLMNHHDLFAFMRQKTNVAWNSSGTMLSKQEFFSMMTTTRMVEEFLELSTIPHEPPIKNFFYLKFQKKNDQTSSSFLKMLQAFSPATPLDAKLIAAAFMTPFWGGDGGTRPAFVITSEKTEEKGGRGVGKSVMVDAVGWLVDSSPIDLKQYGEIDDIKKALINLNVSTCIIRFDNVKSKRYSSADIEALTTSECISGHRLYVGTEKIPNRFTFFFTFNGATFSKDLAQRTVPIFLKRPTYTVKWRENLKTYIQNHRLEIISEILDILGNEAPPIKSTMRFPAWECNVLAKLFETSEEYTQLAHRQTEQDGDDDNFEFWKEQIEDCLIPRVMEYFYDVSDKKTQMSFDKPLAIPAVCLKEWFSKNKIDPKNAMQMLRDNHILGYTKNEKTRFGILYYFGLSDRYYRLTLDKWVSAFLYKPGDTGPFKREEIEDGF